MFLWSLFWIVSANWMRQEILRFSRIVESVLLIYRRKTRNLHLFSLLFALYKELRSGKVRNFAEFFAELSQYVRTCFSSQWLWTENRWSTQIGEILASGVETRHFVELKLGDLLTVPCVIACNCNIRICSTFERSTAKSRISNAFPFLIILKPISKFWIKMCSCSYPNYMLLFLVFLWPWRGVTHIQRQPIVLLVCLTLDCPHDRHVNSEHVTWFKSRDCLWPCGRICLC